MVDLALLLVAVKATGAEFVGVICLHVGFLAYLESKHLHQCRVILPKWLWAAFVLVGMPMYQKIEIIPFLVASFCYTKKTGEKWGVWAPVFRGIQLFFLVAGICGYGLSLPWVALVVLILRNAIGDWRDVEKDKRVGMRTLPMLVNIKHNLQYGHLIAVIMSTFIWWNCTGLSLGVLFCVFVIEVATYNLTPR